MQDEQLKGAVAQFGAMHWKKISEHVPGRSDVQCLHRWQKVLNPKLLKGPWTKEVRLFTLTTPLLTSLVNFCADHCPQENDAKRRTSARTKQPISVSFFLRAEREWRDSVCRFAFDTACLFFVLLAPITLTDALPLAFSFLT